LKTLLKEQISFSIFSEADYSNKQFTVSRLIFLFTVLSVFAAVGLTGFIAVKCIHLHKTIPAPGVLEEASSNQQHLITAQTQQIDLLNKKLNGLKKQFQELQSMKNEICTIGRIAQPVNHENLFGIGGSRGGDMDRTKEADLHYRLNNRTITSQLPKTLRKSIAADTKSANGRMVVLNHSDFYINPIACIPSSLPTRAKITKEETQQSSRSITGPDDSHRGILLNAVEGGEVTAPANGIITYVDTDKASGNTVIIDHGHGYITRYACLKIVTKKLGALVLKGEVIGHADTNPSETPSQFYYEIVLNGLPVNPEKYTAHDPFLL